MKTKLVSLFTFVMVFLTRIASSQSYNDFMHHQMNFGTSQGILFSMPSLVVILILLIMVVLILLIIILIKKINESK